MQDRSSCLQARCRAADGSPQASLVVARDGGFGPLASFVVFVAAPQVLAIAWSVLRLRITTGVAAAMWVLAAASAALVYAYCHRNGADRPADGRPRPRVFYGLGGVLILGGGLVYLYLWLFSFCSPDFSWDSNVYHIPPLHFWAREGRICWVDDTIPVSHYMNGYPKGVELIAFLLVTATGIPSLLNTANLVFLPLGVLGIRSLALRLGADALPAWVAGLAWILVPSIIAQAPTLYVDAAFGSCVIAALACLVHAASTPAQDRAARRRAGLILGCALGLVLAAKSSGPLFLIVSLAALPVAAVLRLGRVEGWLPALRRSAIDICLPVLLLSLTVGGYWYLRNYLSKGSPIYPAGVWLLGHEIFPGEEMERVGYFTANTPAFFREWPGPLKTLYVWAQIGHPGSPRAFSVYGFDGRFGGLGFLWLAGCIPAVAACLWRQIRHPDDSRGSFLMLLAVVGLAFLATPCNWWARYTVWIYGLGLPCLAWGMSRVALSGGSWMRRLARLWIALCLCAAMIEAGVVVLRPMPTTGYLASLLRLQRYEQGSYLFPQWRDPLLTEILRHPVPVALRVSGGVGQGGFPKVSLIAELAVPLGRRDILWLHDLNDDTVSLCRARGIRYILLDDTATIPPGLAEAVTVTHLPGLNILVLPV